MRHLLILRKQPGKTRQALLVTDMEGGGRGGQTVLPFYSVDSVFRRTKSFTFYEVQCVSSSSFSVCL